MRNIKTWLLTNYSATRVYYYYYYLDCFYCFYYLYYLYYYLILDPFLLPTPPTTGHLSNMPPTAGHLRTANSWCLLSVQPTAARRPNLPAKHAPTCWHLQRRALTPPRHRQQLALTANSWRLLALQPTTEHACPDLPGPPKHACQACHHPILLYRGFFPGRKQLGNDKV